MVQPSTSMSEEEVKLCKCAHTQSDHNEEDGEYGACNVINCDCTKFEEI